MMGEIIRMGTGIRINKKTYVKLHVKTYTEEEYIYVNILNIIKLRKEDLIGEIIKDIRNYKFIQSPMGNNQEILLCDNIIF